MNKNRRPEPEVFMKNGIICTVHTGCSYCLSLCLNNIYIYGKLYHTSV